MGWGSGVVTDGVRLGDVAFLSQEGRPRMV